MILHELKMSPYLYEMATVDKNDNVIKMTINKNPPISDSFMNFLKKEGYRKVGEDDETIWFEKE